MKYLLIIIALLITACSGSSSEEEPVKTTTRTEPLTPMTSIWYGDSRCVANHYIENRQCVGGISISGIDFIDPEYDRIIIHLGINSMSWLDSEIWAAKLADLIRGIEYKVWCVMPSYHNAIVSIDVVQRYRNAMAATCTHIADPNIEPLQEDGIHYTDYNYRQVETVYKEIMSAQP